MQEATESSVAPKIADNIVFNGGTHLLPPQSINPIPMSPQFVHHSTLLTAANANATYLVSGSGCPVHQDKPIFHSNSSPLAENFPACWPDRSSLSRETHPTPSLGHVCPMYYRSNGMESRFSFQYPQVSNCDPVIVGSLHAPTVVEAETGFLQNLLGCGNPLDASTGNSGGLSFEMTSGKPVDMGCDLSLRLGPLSTPCLSRESSCIVEDVGSSSSPRGSRFCDLSLSKMRTSQFGCSSSFTCIGKGLPFSPLDTMDEGLEPCSSK